MRELLIDLAYYALFLLIAVVLNLTQPNLSPGFELGWACRIVAFGFGCYAACNAVLSAARYRGGLVEYRTLLSLSGAVLVTVQAFWLFV